MTAGSGSHGQAPKVMAIASDGGHWVQLQRLRPAWDSCRVTYVTTNSAHRDKVLQDAAQRGQPEPGFFVVTPANRWQKMRLVRQLSQIVRILLRVRPDVIVSTGAAPGFLALKVGKILGSRTIWVDSIANVEELSLSGKKAVSCADLWLTQWQHLEGSERSETGSPHYRGSVI